MKIFTCVGTSNFILEVGNEATEFQASNDAFVGIDKFLFVMIKLKALSLIDYFYISDSSTYVR